MKIDFYVELKTLFTLEIFTLLSRLFGHMEQRLDKKAIANFAINDVIG